MPRTFLGLAIIALFSIQAAGEETATPTEMLIPLNVSPAPAPRPALRYLLLPDLREMSPGNPIHGYYRSLMETQNFYFDTDAFQRREKLLAKPLEELPIQEFADMSPSALSQADRAARLDTPDWQIQLRLKTDGIGLLIPDVQQLRALARALDARFRSEIRSGRTDDAIRTAKTMFAMSRHLGGHPTMIGNLVGIAIANLTIGPLEALLEQPGCPNLYWALTNLPSPLVPLDKGNEGERTIMQSEFRDLPEDAPMTAEEIKTAITHFDKLLSEGNPQKLPGGIRGWLAARTKDDTKVTAARRRLVESGLPEARLRQFPAEQVLLLDEKREFEERQDEALKLVCLPAWQWEAMQKQIKKKEPALLADALVPSSQAVRRAQGRLDQRLALLRTVEAIRLHASEHSGKLPAKLTDVSVPLPDDPFTGKPFRYEVVGATAHLRGTPPPGLEKDAHFNLHYALTFVK